MDLTSEHESPLHRRYAGALPRPEWLAALACGIAFGVLAARVGSHPSRLLLLALVAAVVPFAAALVGGLRRLLLFVVVLDIALQWGVNFHYNTSAANLGAIGGIELSATTAALAGLYALWVIDALAKPEQAIKPAWKACTPLFVYVAFCLGSVVFASDRGLALAEATLLVQSLLLFVYVASHVRRADDVRLILYALLACLLLESLVTIASALGFHVLTSVGIQTYKDTTGGSTRYGGTIGSPNTAASFFATLVPIAFVSLLMPIRRRWKAVAIAGIATGLICLALTLSRGGWLALFASTLFIGVALIRSRRIRVPKSALVGVAVVAVLLVPFASRVADRFTQSDQGSGASRVPLIKLTSQILERDPFLGVGVNNVGLVMHDSASLDFARDWIYTVHNKYLLVWAEAGIGALLAFLWFLLSAIRRGVRFWIGGDAELAPLALGLAAAVVGQMVHMMVEIFQSRPQVQLLWLIAALLAAMNCMRTGGRVGAQTAA
jgi:putative inorganic carbon (HCO3(-)) transporter